MDRVTSPDPEFDVFLSYHGGDEAWVGRLADQLRAKDLRVWRDREQIRGGDQFVSRLEEGLKASGCVVFVVSPGSVRSRWVVEEYHRALTLANAAGGAVRLIPILISDAELPGFMSSREYVDFRDASRFGENVEELVFSITGRGQRPPPDPRPEIGATHAERVAEVEYLERAIQRERTGSRRLRRIRMLSPVPGLCAVGAFMLVGGEPTHVWLALGVGLPVGTGLIGWSATVKRIVRSEGQAEQLECLREGLEVCRGRTNPNCTRLRDRFWEIVEQRVSAHASARHRSG